MMFLKHLISTNACKSPLPKAILTNSLVNLQGKPDTWFEIDLFNEHLNYDLKELIYVWKNSIFNVDILFKTTALTGYYCSQLRTQLEKFVGEQTNPAHTVKSPATDIHTLAYVLSKEGISWS